MFDIGFWELALIMLVALVIIGPERLPGIARKGGIWFGRARQMVANVKADIDREIKAGELKRIMEEQARSTGIHEMVDEAKAGLRDIDSPPDSPSTTPAPPPSVEPATAEKADTSHRDDAKP